MGNRKRDRERNKERERQVVIKREKSKSHEENAGNTPYVFMDKVKVQTEEYMKS